MLFLLSSCNWFSDSGEEDRDEIFYHTFSIDLGNDELDSVSNYDSTRIYSDQRSSYPIDTLIQARYERYNNKNIRDMIYQIRINPIPLEYFDSLQIMMLGSSYKRVAIDVNGYAKFSSNDFNEILGDNRGMYSIRVISVDGNTTQINPSRIDIQWNETITLSPNQISENDTVEYTWGLDGGFESLDP